MTWHKTIVLKFSDKHDGDVTVLYIFGAEILCCKPIFVSVANFEQILYYIA